MGDGEQALPDSKAPIAETQHLPSGLTEDAATKDAAMPRNHVPRILAFLSVFVLPVVFCVLSVLIARAMQRTEKECQNYECQKASDYISTSVANELQPCDDFYQYTCRNWKAKYGAHMEAQETLVHLSGYFNGSGTPTENFEKATNALASCTASFARASDQSIAEILNFVNGDLKLNWPHQATNITAGQIFTAIVKLQLTYNIYPFFSLRFNDALETMTASAAERYHPWYLRYPETAKREFREALITAVTQETNNVTSDILVSNILKVEDAVNNISTTDEEHLLAKSEVLSDNYFNSTWKLMTAVRDYLPSKQKYIFQRKTLVLANQVGALRNTFTFLNSDLNAQAVANYIAWTVIEILGRRTSKSIRKALMAISVQHNVQSISEPSLHRDVCYYETYRLFALVLDRQIYLKIDPNIFTFFDDALKTVKLFVKSTLEELFWMDSNTVRRLQKRLDGFANDVGILKRFMNVEVEDAYNNLPFIDQDEDFTRNYLNITKGINDRLLEKNFRYTYFPSLWSIVPRVRYVADYNTFYIPASVLIKPLFMVGNFPLGLVYGRVVSQVFLELFIEGYRSHMLGHTGAWSYATERKFKIYMDCYEDGYGNATNDLQDPAIAYFKSGALSKTFQMYQMEAHRKGENYRLPDSNLTGHQLFFVATCLDLCTRNPEEETQMAALCNLPLRRVKDFSRVFGCSPTHPLGHLRMNCSGFRIMDELIALKRQDVIETSLTVEGDD